MARRRRAPDWRLPHPVRWHRARWSLRQRQGAPPIPLSHRGEDRRSLLWLRGSEPQQRVERIEILGSFGRGLGDLGDSFGATVLEQDFVRYVLPGWLRATLRYL